jgi:hypothetical protein
MLLEEKLPRPTDGLEQKPGLNYADPANYLLVGCDYYLKSLRPDACGHLIEVLIPWKFAQIKRDFAENPSLIKQIPRYLGLGCFPCNSADGYQVEVNGYYNTYSKLYWVPTAGRWPLTEEMIRHIFGEQYEYGLDYLQLLYLRPKQMLPILILVSKSRETGKTTFLNYLKEIFGANVVFVTNENMRSRFNAERASKLGVFVDEALLNKKEDSERLKALSTARTTFIEFKGRDRFEVDNFAKIILCSNSVNAPAYIDAEETRYWVREIPVLESKHTGMLEAMKEEIPAFLDFLIHRKLHVPEAQSRMWFRMEDLQTPALSRIIRACRPTPELELAETIIDLMDKYSVDTLCYTSTDLAAVLKSIGRDIRDAHRIVCKQWEVPHADNKLAYDLYAPYVEQSPRRQYGRFYTFTRKYLSSLILDSSVKSEETRNHNVTLF